MIFKDVPADIELVPPEMEPSYPESRKPFRVTKHVEFVGGLGDSLLRMYDSDWYSSLDLLREGERASVALMIHNPYAVELFRWHRNANRLFVYDLGFNTPYHPWDNQEFRAAHGLPSRGPSIVGGTQEKLTFYSSPEDHEVLERLNAQGDYILLSATAATAEKTVPMALREEIASAALAAGFKVAVVGRRHYFTDGRECDLKPRDGVIDLVDKLSVPGTLHAVEGCAGIVSAHSSMLHPAWRMNRPVFLLYDDGIRDKVVPCGAHGYMAGMGRQNTDHMHYDDFTAERLERWLAYVGSASKYARK